MENLARCPLCGRDCPPDMMQRHHRSTRKVDRFGIDMICSDCHKTIHAFFENKRVAKELNNVEALLANEDFARALAFIRKQPAGSRIRARRSRKRRRRG
jgi:hypothetical protein